MHMTYLIFHSVRATLTNGEERIKSSYSKFPIIRLSMVFVESGLNSGKVSLMSVIYVEKCIFGTETSGLNREGGLNFEWSL